MTEWPTMHLRFMELEIKTKMADDASNEGKTTVEDLNRIITEPTGGFFMMPSNAYNEVFDGIFLGEA